MRITCRYWRGCLVKALSEALPPKRRLGLERHLQRCPHCRLEQEQLREVARRLRPFAAANYAGPSPAEDAARVKAALRRAMDVEAVLPPQAGRQRRPPSLRWAAGGVILGVLLGVGVPWVARVYEARRPAPYQVQGIVVSNPVLGPIAGAHVAAFPAAVFERDVMPALYSAGHWAARPVAETFANSRGHFTLPLRRPGKYFLVSKNGERSVPLVWEVTCPQRSATRWHSSSGVSGTLLQGVDSRAPAETRPRPDTVAVGSITGRALLPGGKAPAVAALVVPYSTDGPFKGSDATFDVAGVRFYARSCPESFTDSQGKYVLTDLPAGEYRIAFCTSDAYLASMSKNPLE